MTTALSTQVVSGASRARMPDFLIIGAAKSGTTTLHQLLGKHPRVFVSRIKEPEFFAVDAVYERGVAWYQALFQDAKPDQLSGEASTAYTRWPQFPEASDRISRMLSNVKLMYVMRHPIDRAYSHYVHRVTRELYPHQPIRWTFEEHVKRDPMCLDGSRYMDQIDRYLRFYPKEAFLLLLTEDLNRRPVETVGKAWGFLGLDEVAVDNADKKSNEGSEIRDGRIRRYTMSPLRRIPILRNLKGVIPKGAKDRLFQWLNRSPYGKWVERRHTPQLMLPETRARLVEEFRPHNRRLGEFLGRDLSHWDR
ncbi:MAG: sulfotransferase [Planctomycetota bacterium]